MDEFLIAKNKKAFFEYTIHEHIEVGIVLEGWEVKGLRLGKGQITEAHAILRKGEIWLLGSRIQAPKFAVAYKLYDETRTRKLLLKRKQIDKLEGLINRQGYTLIPLKLYWKGKGHLVKCELALATGKKNADKRATIKEREWAREKQRTLKINTRSV